mgnify:CR=1 FL=1
MPPLSAPPQAPAAAEAMASSMLRLEVAGAHMSGLRLNHQLTDLGAKMQAAAMTAPVYRECTQDAPVAGRDCS